MTDLRSKMIDQLTCSICQELFTTPKLLDCLHRFCEDCLHRYIMSRDFNHINGIECPKCRQSSSVKNYRRDLEKRHWAQEYQTDFETESLCDILREDNETCTTHPNRQVLGYCRFCRLCACEECDQCCDGFTSLNAEVKRRKSALQKLQDPLKDKLIKLREQINVTKEEREMLKKNYNSSVAKIEEEFDRIRKLVDEEEAAVGEYLGDLRDEEDEELGKLEKEKKKRLRLMVVLVKKLENAISTKSSVRFIEKTHKSFDTFDENETDEAIKPGSYAEKTNFIVRKARIERIRKHIKRIVPYSRNGRIRAASGNQSAPSDTESEVNTSCVISPPPTPYTQDHGYFPSSLSISSPISQIGTPLTLGAWFHQT